MTATDATRATLVPVGPFDPRLRIAVAGWLAGFKPATRVSYTQAIDQWLAWCAPLGVNPLQVERAHVDLWARHLEENRRLAPATVMHRLCVIRSFYRYCEDEDLVVRSPASRVLDTAIGDRTSGPLLLTAANTRMTRFNAGKVVARLGRRAQLPYHVHPHMLRHSFATTALDAGVPLHDVQDSMNHADPRTTMRYHRHRHSLDRNATHLVTAFLAAG